MDGHFKDPSLLDIEILHENVSYCIGDLRCDPKYAEISFAHYMCVIRVWCNSWVHIDTEYICINLKIDPFYMEI